MVAERAALTLEQTEEYVSQVAGKVICNTDADREVVKYLKTNLVISMIQGLAPDNDSYYKGIFDFLLREGKFYSSEPLSQQESITITKLIKRSNRTFKPNNCFFNAQFLSVISTDNIQYVEGYSLNAMPVHHSWITINNKVVDVTKDDGQYILGSFPEDRSYFGVAINTNIVRKTFNMAKIGSVINQNPDIFFGSKLLR